jgi:Flp pilus assembly protein TadG
MHAKLNHTQRGQAVVETVMFLPMFLLALFGVMWTVQAAVQYERAQSAVRYSGLIAQSDSPYADYSLYAMYSQLPATTLPVLTCNQPQAVLDTLSDASPTYTSPEVPTASAPFWAPAAPPSQTCPTPALVGIPAGTGLTQDMLLTERNPSVTSTVNVPAALTNMVGTSTSVTATGYFFRTVGVNTIVGCYSNLKTQIKMSLNYANAVVNDTSAATVPVALANSFATIALTPRTTCTTL